MTCLRLAPAALDLEHLLAARAMSLEVTVGSEVRIR